MAIQNKVQDTELTLLDAIESASREIVNREFDKAIQVAIDNLNQQRDEFLTKMAARVRSWSRIEDFSHQIVITIEKADNHER